MDQQNRDIYGLQLLRAIAAFGVIFRHTLDMSDGSGVGRFSPAWTRSFGGAGVDLFFVISGFIMVYVSFPPSRSSESPSRFFVKRLTRIFPLYWICSAAIVAMCTIGFLKNKHVDSYTLINSIFILPGDKLVYVAWTLSYELYFYIIFAVCLNFRKKLRTSISTVCIMLGGILVGHLIRDSTFSVFICSPLVLEFCFGIALALLFSSAKNWNVPIALSVLALLVIVVGPIFADQTGSMSEAFRLVVWGFPAAVIVAAFLKLKLPHSKAGRAAVLLGDASYALYLTHVFVMIAYGWLIKSTFVGGMSQVGFVPAVVFLCLIVGVVAHIFVERPTLHFVRKLTSRQPGRGLLEAKNVSL
ncbi:acyltransferase [Mesorhizobium sp. LNJC405B00]|uniref:acyltransferase family protein n=1 Tax=unclassified Mesorhizobium TaxID=325217 RepID=UPI0003CE2889|nr:acyltransferase [Mesorhizobium sp. LNJC405B00]ESX98333.1 hypothetical protein X755_16180 [Mesorhizobium sp. LNJC405B00]